MCQDVLCCVCSHDRLISCIPWLHVRVHTHTHIHTHTHTCTHTHTHTHKRLLRNKVQPNAWVHVLSAAWTHDCLHWHTQRSQAITSIISDFTDTRWSLAHSHGKPMKMVVVVVVVVVIVVAVVSWLLNISVHWPGLGGDVVCWLLNVSATSKCISGTDLLRQLYVLPHWDRSCRSDFPSNPVTVYWHWANQSQHWP